MSNFCKCMEPIWRKISSREVFLSRDADKFRLTRYLNAFKRWMSNRKLVSLHLKCYEIRKYCITARIFQQNKWFPSMQQKWITHTDINIWLRVLNWKKGNHPFISENCCQTHFERINFYVKFVNQYSFHRNKKYMIFSILHNNAIWYKGKF